MSSMPLRNMASIKPVHRRRGLSAWRKNVKAQYVVREAWQRRGIIAWPVAPRCVLFW